MVRASWLLFATLGVIAVAAAQVEKKDVPQAAVKHEASHDVDLQELLKATDLRPQIGKLRLRDGLNQIETTRSGLRIAAKAERGRIVEYVATDRQGRAVRPTEFSLFRKTAGTTETPGPIRCWHCYRNPDGSTDCFEVACPFTAR